MQPEEFKSIQSKFRQGVEKLELVQQCLVNLAQNNDIDIAIDALDKRAGELTFWFAGTRYYVRIRITDRDVDDLEPGFRVPIGLLDWGRYGNRNQSETPDQTNYYDERGLLFELDKEDFYCGFSSCSDPRVVRSLTSVLQKLATRTIAISNAGG